MAYNVGAVLGSVKFDVRDAVVNVNNFKNAVNDIPRSTQPATRAIISLSSGALYLTTRLGAIAAVLAAVGYGTKRALDPLIGVFNQGIGLLDELRLRTAGFAAALKAAYPAAPFQEALHAAQQLIPLIEQMDATYSGSGEELITLADAMLKYGLAGEVMKTITDETGKQRQNFIALAEAIKAQTAGQNLNIQLYQELRALVSGQRVEMSALMQYLKGQNAEIAKQVQLWIQQGTLLENLGPYLQGYVEASAVVADSLSAQRASWETILHRILRAGMLPAYQELSALQRQINRLIYDQQGALTTMGNTIAFTLTASWESVRISVETVYELLKNMLGPLTSSQGMVRGIAADFLTLQNNLSLMVETATQFLTLIGSVVAAMGVAIHAGLQAMQGNMRVALEEVKAAGGQIKQAWQELTAFPERWFREQARITTLPSWKPTAGVPEGKPDLGALRGRQQAEGTAPAAKAEAKLTKEIQDQIGMIETRADRLRMSETEEAALLQAVIGEYRSWYAKHPLEYENMLAKIEGLRRQAMEKEATAQAAWAKRYREVLGEQEQADSSHLSDQFGKTITNLADLLEAYKKTGAEEAAAGDEFRTDQLEAQEQYEAQRMDLEAQYHQEARAWAVQTGEMSEAEYIAELERERQGLVIWQSIYDKKSITYQQLALQILDRDREIHAARMQQARTELAAVDAEIEHTGEGHEQKIALLDELIAGEQNVEIQLGRQQERRQALSAWMDHDLGLLDDERLTLEQQRDLLEQILQKWQAIGDFSAIQGIEKRLRAVNDALRATALTITNVLGGALSGIGSSLVDFFDKAMLRAADWHDFMQSIYAALRHSIAQMAADLVTAQLTAAITPQVATPQVESLLPAGGTGQQFNQGATTFAVAVATLVPALGQWAGAAIGLATSAVTQTQAAGQQVVAAGQNVAAGTQMDTAAGTQAAAGSQMQDASWAMLPAAANILGGALKMQGPASLIFAAAQLIAAAKSIIPFLQHGAVVTRPTLAMLGEAGPEAVIPLDAAAGAAGISIFSPSGAFAEYLSLLADFFEDFIRGTIQWGDLLGHIRDMLRDILGLDSQRGLMAALGLQHGGFVTGPTLAMLGEAGPEVVLPLKPSVPHQFMPSLPSTRLSDFFGREQPGRIPLYITIEHLNLSADSVDELGMRRFARRIGGAIGDELDRALLRMPAIQAGVA